MIAITYVCKICGKTINCKSPKTIKFHIVKDHELIWEDYLREYHPELGTGYCLECGKETSSNGFFKGFNKFCSKKCGSVYLQKHRTEQQKEEMVKRVKQTKLERYGSENYVNYEQRCETNLKKYGVECSFQAEEVKNKIKYQIKNKYGSDYFVQTEEFKTKYKNTCLEKYGVENANQSDIIKEKSKQTCLEKYGVEYSSQSIIFREKASKTVKRKNYLTTKNNLQNRNIILLDTKEEYVNNSIHRFLCQEHGEFQRDDSDKRVVFCPNCFKAPISDREKEVAEFLSQYITLETSNKTILNGKELDIWIPSHNLAIEFDGIYWHCNLHKEKSYHLEKTVSCEEQNIQLVHIFENEWINKRPIVESILLAKLGIFQKRIYGRKCEVKIVSQELYKEFSELNHLQGYVPAKLILGLYYEDELVEICSFGKSRFKSGENELIRHCSKLHLQVIGGFSKLISCWKKLNQNEVLFTYCDRRYSTGQSYIASGWKHVGTSAPNYFYVSGVTLENRIKYQKHKLPELLETFDSNLTEQENMSLNGYKWIYDCGNLKFKI